MEKGTPHCRLSVVRALVEAGKMRGTYSALSGAAARVFDFDAVIVLVKALTAADFYKSMTTHADHLRRLRVSETHGHG